MKKATPYSGLPETAFWKTAVSEKSALQLSGIYKRKFPISPTDRIATGGSCFAQHIARHLVGNGFAFQDYEPAPAFVPESLRSKFGYGVFSARYANIYTVRQLLQTFRRAVGTFSPEETVWSSGGRYFDPFRPAIEPDGFATANEVEASRATHLAAVRRLFLEADVYIFTFGLTEAWVSRSDGAVYPTCPGTVAGDFDGDRYAFVNFSYDEILKDFEAFVAELLAVNPAIRMLLTVSPVPLTATASPEHVLTATVYSKSVLRAVAGYLSKTHEFIDYFPSFELVSSHPMRAMFFAPNLREVTTEGVEIVMRHFFAEHRAAHPAAAPSKAHPRRRGAVAAPRKRQAEIVCEEMLLEQQL
jgi:hypothetical protein